MAPRSSIVAVAALRFVYTVTLGRDWNPADVLPLPTRRRHCPRSLVSQSHKPGVC
jgi:integrase/recombinase XerD